MGSGASFFDAINTTLRTLGETLKARRQATARRFASSGFRRYVLAMAVAVAA